MYIITIINKSILQKKVITFSRAVNNLSDACLSSFSSVLRWIWREDNMKYGFKVDDDEPSHTVHSEKPCSHLQTHKKNGIWVDIVLVCFSVLYLPGLGYMLVSFLVPVSHNQNKLITSSDLQWGVIFYGFITFFSTMKSYFYFIFR